VVHVSGVYVQDEDIADGRLAGSDDYFLNPVDYGVLAARIDELLAPA
jgi:DNA-binding response OmpR family regulator